MSWPKHDGTLEQALKWEGILRILPQGKAGRTEFLINLRRNTFEMLTYYCVSKDIVLVYSSSPKRLSQTQSLRTTQIYYLTDVEQRYFPVQTAGLNCFWRLQGEIHLFSISRFQSLPEFLGSWFLSPSLKLIFLTSASLITCTLRLCTSCLPLIYKDTFLISRFLT